MGTQERDEEEKAASGVSDRRKTKNVGREKRGVGDYRRPNFNGGRSAEDGEQGSKIKKREREDDRP
jgi:hypothetical protein